MSDTPPDRLCNNPKSPFFNEELLERIQSGSETVMAFN